MDAFAPLTLGEQPAPNFEEDGRVVAEQPHGMSSECGESSPTGTKKDLPVELWMQIMDNLAEISDSRLLTRAHAVERYEELLQTSDLGLRTLNTGEQTDQSTRSAEAELEAAMLLPRLERRSWLLTRAYYQINTRGRAAAVKVRLSSRLLTASHRLIYTADHQHCMRPHPMGIARWPENVPRIPPCTVFQLPPWPVGRSRDEYLESFRLLFSFLDGPGCTSRKRMPPFTGPRVGEALFFENDIKILVPGVHWEDLPDGCPSAYRVALACDVAEIMRELRKRRAYWLPSEHWIVEVI